VQHIAGASAPSSAAPAIIRFGVFEVDLQSGELRESGTKVRLEGQPFQILRILLEHPGRLVTREELRGQLWPADTFVDFETGINTAIKRLRQALQDNAETPQYVETLPRRGYRFIHPLERAEAPAPSVAALRNGQRVAALTVAALLAALVGSLAFNVAGLRDRIFSAKARSPLRLAVLPLDNLSGSTEKDYLVAALQEQLITYLNQIQTFEVPGREAVKNYKPTQTPLADIGRTLDADAMVTGSVLQSGDQILVNLHLTRADSDHALWSEEYKRDLRSVLNLAVEAARTVAGQLGIRISPQEEAQLGRDRPVVPEAFELYLKGRYGTRENPRRQIEYFRQAIALDDGFALAWQALSDAWWSLLLRSELRPSEGYPYARDAAIKALSLDDSLGRAHTALARIKYTYEWQWDEVEEHLARARALNPNAIGSNYRVWTGSFKEAIDAFTKGIARDPVSAEARQNLGYAYLMSGEHDAAIQHYRQAISMDPERGAAYVHLAQALALLGRDTEAITECETGLSKGPVDQSALADCAWIYAVSGRRDEAMRLMKQIEALAPAKWVDPLHLARIWDGLGDTARALKKFQEAYDEHSAWMGRMRMWPMLSKQLRDDRRFEALLQKVGLPNQSPPPPGFVRPVAK
jgi:DNA-binding winged helix-turn-helix (wHTH) protein/TolB-like protein/Flp pilus assembly protein TadD